MKSISILRRIQNEISNIQIGSINAHIEKSGLQVQRGLKTPKVFHQRNINRSNRFHPKMRSNLSNTVAQSSKNVGTIRRSFNIPGIITTILKRKNVGAN